MKRKNLLFTLLLLCLTTTLTAQMYNETPRFRVSASGGLGYLIASGQDDIAGVVNKEAIDKANKDLRLATHLNGDIHYLFNGGWGLGAKYLFQKTSAEVKDLIIDVNDGAHYQVTDFWEKDYINFVGPSLFGYYNIGSSDNFLLVSSLSVGYAWLRSEASVLSQNLLITGGNIGMNAEIGFDFLLNPNIGIGVNAGYFFSTFGKIKATDGTITQEQTLDKDSRYNAFNIHLSIGLRYYLNN